MDVYHPLVMGGALRMLCIRFRQASVETLRDDHIPRIPATRRGEPAEGRAKEGQGGKFSKVQRGESCTENKVSVGWAGLLSRGPLALPATRAALSTTRDENGGAVRGAHSNKTMKHKDGGRRSESRCAAAEAGQRNKLPCESPVNMCESQPRLPLGMRVPAFRHARLQPAHETRRWRKRRSDPLAGRAFGWRWFVRGNTLLSMLSAIRRCSDDQSPEPGHRSNSTLEAQLTCFMFIFIT